MTRNCMHVYIATCLLRLVVVCIRAIMIGYHILIAFVSCQGVATFPTSTLRTSAFLAQNLCHSLETYTKLG